MDPATSPAAHDGAAASGDALAMAATDAEEPDQPTVSVPLNMPLSTSSGSLNLSIPTVPRVGIPRALKHWDRYEVLGILGAGGMGAVYKARDPRLNRFVALKIVHPMLGHAAETRGEFYIRRFLREARLQASLDHPNICKVYEVGEMPGSDADEPGYPYIAMQLIEGRPLQSAQADLSLFEKALITQQVANALHTAHRQGLIHRDIKPGNILVERTEDGKFHPYVVDFGLAQEAENSDRSRSGIIEGTPRFMSPEQARGDTKHLDHRTDIYSLGVTLYELLVGRSPYPGTNDMDILVAVMTADPIPLRTVDGNMPADLEAIALKCIEKEPAARYDSAKALANDLERFLSGEPVQARHIGLAQLVYRRARRHKAVVALGMALVITLCGLLGYGVKTRLQAQERERQSRQQTALAQRLGQEIKDMEWLLRSARQLPLHDLEREKIIIRRRMKLLEAELSGYGALGRGLAYYALGRGHLALHEYAQARTQLELALQHGNQSADVQYTLGLVLGRHYEQAMEEALMGGGGDWAKKQLKASELQYMTPAIAALQRSRDMKLDAPEYLEGLVAYYQRDYDAALKHAAAALIAAPWLYEASKLAGDVHRERAVQARDSGRYDEAAREFGDAVRSYEEAAQSGRSDAEVYAGLADAWVYQIEVLSRRNQGIDEAVAAALAAGSKLAIAEPSSTAGALRKAHAAVIALDYKDPAVPPELLRECLTSAEFVLQKDPGNPYASERAAFCLHHAAAFAKAHGEDPEPLLRKAIGLLEPAVKKNPQFLWGNSDLAGIYCELGTHLYLHGNPAAKELLERALEYIARATALDPNFLRAYSWALEIRSFMVLTARSDAELQLILAKADAELDKSKIINPQDPYGFNSHLNASARAAWRTYLAGIDPQPRLQRARESLAQSRKLGGPFLDVEQPALLVYFVDASARVQARRDPGPALTDAEPTLARCLKLNPQDVTCQLLAAKIDWVESDWLAQQGKPALAALLRARQKLITATQSPEKHPDCWQALAETELRLARWESNPAARDTRLREGLKVVDSIFAMNPNHALGRATQGALLLAEAEGQRDLAQKRSTAGAAVEAFAAALLSDPLLAHNYAPLLAQAKSLITSP